MNKIAQLLLIAGLSSISANSIVAEEIRVPVAQQGAADLKLPKKGTSKAAVRKQFGEPEAESATVGQPPISNWRYAKFTVYFEYNHVIHAVIHHK